MDLTLSHSNGLVNVNFMREICPKMALQVIRSGLDFGIFSESRSGMRMTRRQLVSAIAGAPALFSARAAFGQDALPETEKGPFDGSLEGLKAYQIPDWFKDAKFGIWAHWGPQSAAEDGDWYARRMYIEGEPQYKSHLERFGHPSKFGHKDICKMWTAKSSIPII